MLFVAGLVLLGLTVGMIFVARPADGIAAPFLKNWVLGQTYALAALSSAVIGVSLMLNDLPR
jgi:hypothetical protein